MAWDKFTNKYDDIIDMPHHVSKTRPHMSMEDRAAQFSPFAALTGHEEAIEETARLTDVRIELDEDRKEKLNEKLSKVVQGIGSGELLDITYFVPDELKSGGEYVRKKGAVKKYDEYERVLVMEDGEKIQVREILEIE